MDGVEIMKYYKDAAGNVYAYNSIQTPKEGLVPMTETEVETHLNPKIPFATAKENKYAEIAAARYNAEIAGVTVNGVSIKTDRESQGLITGAALKAMQDNTYTCRWKGIDGFVELTAPQIIAIADAVRAHVQSCFDHEAELQPLIESAETEAELDAISW
jgi:hypothetical protein